MADLLDRELYKLDPKLRMMANGNSVVNALRAEQCSSVAVFAQELLDEVPLQREPESTPIAVKEIAGKAGRGKLDEIPSEIYANVFIGLAEGSKKLPKSVRYAWHDLPAVRKQNLVAAAVPLDRLQDLLDDPAVTAVELGERITFDTPTGMTTRKTAPAASLRRFGRASLHKDGDGVLIGIIDAQGFDFAHPDFLDESGETRFLRIWDQGGDSRPGPEEFGYGAEIMRDHLNAAIRASDEFGLEPQQLEPQSQMSISSHATHVASIAAGNNGVCRRAHIAGVLISLPAEDADRRQSFYDSTRIAHAIDYLFNLGLELGMPVSINISLGTNGHAHDASSAINRWIDYALTTTGRSVCVAAGNAGQEAAETPGDWGFVMGRIHTSGIIPAAGLMRDIEWIVVGNGIADLSENELEVWYSPQDRFAVELKAPGDTRWIGPVEPGEYIENHKLSEGTFISIYNELYAPSNGHNRVSIYLSPFFSPHGLVGVRSGTWMVRMHGREVRDGSYHGWIERDDPRRLGKVGMQEGWSFPSFFSERSNVDSSSVSSLACGHRLISVANLDEENERVHFTSSQGPTRDNRDKPEISAPGKDILAANGFAGSDDPWIKMTGTSMASPYVAGVIGLMLAIEPKLSAAQISGIIRRTSKPLPDANFAWRNDTGFGRINPLACIQEAGKVNQRKDLTP
jgi:subtilisin family serine protease